MKIPHCWKSHVSAHLQEFISANVNTVYSLYNAVFEDSLISEPCYKMTILKKGIII